MLDKLAPAVASGMRTEEVMRTLVGVCRDLRGVLAAAHNRATYTQVFEALFPNHIRTISRAADVSAESVLVGDVCARSNRYPHVYYPPPHPPPPPPPRAGVG